MSIDPLSLNAQHWESGATALHIASLRGHVGVVEELLRFGADPNVRDVCGLTALHWGAAYEDVLLALLSPALGAASQGANLLAVRSQGDESALHFSAYHGASECCAALLAAGAEAAPKDVCGATPLHLAASLGHGACVEALLAFRASSVVRDRAGNRCAPVPQPGVV